MILCNALWISPKILAVFFFLPLFGEWIFEKSNFFSKKQPTRIGDFRFRNTHLPQPELGVFCQKIRHILFEQH